MQLRLYFCLIFSSLAFANPKGGSVKAGSACIREKGAVLEIKAADRSVLHWDSFSIRAHETTRFSLPSKDSAVLNRVTGPEISKLMGKLQADGKVYLVNPNGIIIGKDAVINTTGFIASTLNVQMKDFFEAQDLHFLGDNFGKIENLGTIVSSTGPVVLLAYEVANQGMIEASHVSLGAGSEFLVKPSGDTDLYIRPDSRSYIDQEGAIKAMTVEMQTDGALALAINHDGIIQANRVEKKGGRVFLRAEEGTIHSSAESKIEAGEVVIEGKSLHLDGEIIAPKDQVFIRGESLFSEDFFHDEVFHSGGYDPFLTAVTFSVSGGDTTVSSGSTMTLQDAVTITGSGTFTFTAGGDLTLGADITTDNVDLTMKGGSDISATSAISITTTGTATLILVADNANPTSPSVGYGAIILPAAATLTTNNGKLQLYSGYATATNTFPTLINGVASPGTPIAGVYYPNGVLDTPFQIYFKSYPPASSSVPVFNAHILPSIANTLPNQNTEESKTQSSSGSDIQTTEGLNTQSTAPCSG